ncbi:hypothetical protein DFH06DRAFT_1475223 [Mycena polygramma]|nr:hypothetical protein DFH06DRAFT_1475223 [Mycena polygramma]
MSNQIDGLWFSNDQLVALRAGESIFRVPKSILAARSSVFQAMFEFPQPAASDGEMKDGDEIIDGSPVVCLHDSPTEVEPFLRAIFDSSYFMPPPAEVGFHEVLGILRLSHKYDVGYLYKRALRHMETVYPIQLEDVDSINDNNKLGYDDSNADLDLLAIPILHEVGAVWLLPYAYYNLATFTAERLFEEGLHQFPSYMQRICILLQARNVQGTHRIFEAITPLSNCASRDACNGAKFKFLKERHRPSNLANLMPLYERPSLVDGVCSDCSVRAQAQYHEARAAIWNKLPATCGMEKWEVLLGKRRLALEL